MPKNSSSLPSVRAGDAPEPSPDGESYSYKHLSQLEAVGLALLGYTLWVFSDASLKFAGSSTLPSYEVTGLLGLSIASLLLIYGLWRRKPGVLWPKSPTRLLFRSLLDVSNAFGVVIALRHMPLALFYIFVFCSPMVSTLLAALFLGETLQARGVLAVVVGFLGIVVAVDPFHLSQGAEKIGYLACLMCVLSFSTNVVWSRRLTQTEGPESLAFFSGVVIAAASFLAMLGRPFQPPARFAGIIVVAGLFNVLGSFCFFRALRWAPAGSVSQCHYSQLLTGALIGFFVWHESLSVPMMFGAILIIAAGCYTATIVKSCKGDSSLK